MELFLQISKTFLVFSLLASSSASPRHWHFTSRGAMVVVLVDSVAPPATESPESDDVAFDASDVEFDDDSDGDETSSVLVELSRAKARNRQDTNR